MEKINKMMVEVAVSRVKNIEKDLENLEITKEHLEGELLESKRKLFDFLYIYPGDIFLIGNRVYKFVKVKGVAYSAYEGYVLCSVYPADSNTSSGYSKHEAKVAINVLEPNYTIIKRAEDEK